MDNVYVLTIYSENKISNDIDIIFQILSYETVFSMCWWIEYLDYTGKDAQEICNLINKSKGLIVSGCILIDYIKECEQIFDAVIWGYANKPPSLDTDLTNYPNSESLIAIQVIEDIYVDIYTRDIELKNNILQKFQKVNNNELKNFFPNQDLN